MDEQRQYLSYNMLPQAIKLTLPGFEPTSARSAEVTASIVMLRPYCHTIGLNSLRIYSTKFFQVKSGQ